MEMNAQNLDEYDWSVLNHLQLGRYSEYLVKMEFTRLGFDVYEPEVDDRGIDFLIRKEVSKVSKTEIRYYEIQVKSLRKWGYIFISKDKLTPTNQRLVAVVHFPENKEPPKLYLIPSTEWLQAKSPLLVERDYGKSGQKSKPEWGLNLSHKNLELLSKYELDQVAKSLSKQILECS